MMEGRIKDQIAYIHPLIPLKEAKTDVLSKVPTRGRKRDAEIKKRVEIEDEIKRKRAAVIERSRRRGRRRNNKKEGNGDTRICREYLRILVSLSRGFIRVPAALTQLSGGPSCGW